MASRQDRWQAALAKATALGTRPRQLGNGHYDVIGSAGDTYRVVRADASGFAYTCTCPAGRAEAPCYHAAAVASLPYERAGRAAARRRRSRQVA